MSVTQLNAKAKAYLNTEEQDFSDSSSSYERDIIYPPEYDNINRKGQKWHVLDIDLESIYGPFNVNENDIFEIKVDNPYRNAFISTSKYVPGKRTLYLADLYYYFYKNIDFRFKIYDVSGNMLSGDNIKLIKDDIEYENFSFNTSIGSETCYLDWQDKNKEFTYYNRTISTFNANEYDEFMEYSSTKIRKIIFKLIDDKNDSTNELPKDATKIRLFVDQKTYENDNAFFEYSFKGDNKIDSFKIMNSRRFIPITLYDDNDQKILDVKLSYIKAYFYPYDTGIEDSCDFTYEYYYDYYDNRCGVQQNLLQIEILDQRIILETCSHIGFELAIDRKVSYSDVKYKAGNHKGEVEKVENISGLQKFLYFGNSEIPCKIMSNDHDEKIEVCDNILLNDTESNLNITFKDSAFAPSGALSGTLSGAFALHLLPISLYTYEKDITDIKSTSISSTIEFENLTPNTTTLIIKKLQLIDDSTQEQMLCVNQKLIAIKDANGNDVPFNKQSTSWKINSLNVQLNQSPTTNRLTFVFQSFYNIIDKNEFDINLKNLKEFHPNMYLIKDGVELSSNYLYVHKDLSSYMYFENELDLSNSKYKIKMIDFQRIYKFNTHILNYFDKYLITDLSSFQTNDENEDKLNNLTFTIYEKSKDDEITGSFKTFDSRYINGGHWNRNSWPNTWVDSLSEPIPYASASFNNVREDWKYKIKASTIYKKNDFLTKLDILDEDVYVDRSLSSFYRFTGKSPFVHYYGWVTDSIGNKIFDTPGMLNDVPSSWRKNYGSYSPTTEEYDQSFSNSPQKIYHYYKYDSDHPDIEIVTGRPLLNATSIAKPYFILKKNDTPIHIKLTNTDLNLSSDLQYESTETPVVVLSGMTETEWSKEPKYYRYGEYPDYYYNVEFVEGTSALYIATYERAATFQEYKNDYDFFFADFVSIRQNQGDIVGKNEKIYPGEYHVSIYQGDEKLKENVFSKSLLKNDEENGETYNKTIEWPNVNINGKITNSFGGLVHRDGTIVRLTNNETKEKFEFRYSCAYPLEEGLIGEAAYSPSGSSITQYSEDAKTNITLYFNNEYNNTSWCRRYWCNAWDEHFRFMYSGVDCQNLYYLENWYASGDMGSSPVIIHNCDSIKSSPAVPEGRYRLDLISYDGKLISTYFNDLEVSKERQQSLYDLTLELPYCTVSGVLHTENRDLCYGNDWKVKMTCIDNKEYSREMTMWSRDPASDNAVFRFAFSELGTLRDCIGSGMIHTIGSVYNSVIFDEFFNESLVNKLGINTSGYLKDYCEPGLMPGEYQLTVEYNGIKMYSHPENIIVSKENEISGRLSFDITVPDIFTNIHAQIINDQFSSEVISSYGNIFSLNEENYDDDITDDFNDPSRIRYSQKTTNSIDFERVSNLGRYAVNLSATYVDGKQLTKYDNYLDRNVQAGFEIPLNDVKDSVDYSIFSESGTLHPSMNVISVKNAKKEDGSTMLDIHVPYWYSYWGKIYTYSDEHCIEDNTPSISPMFHTSIRVDNITLNEGWDSLSSNMTKKYEYEDEYEYYYGNYQNAVNEWSDILSLTKTGTHRITLKKAANDQILYTEDYLVSGCNHDTEKNNPRNIISNSLGMNTLNISVLYKRQDIQKYQVLTGRYFDFIVCHKDSNNNIKSWYDRPNYEEYNKLANRLLIEKSYPVEFTAKQKTSYDENSSIIQKNFRTTIDYPKFALRMLPPSGTIIMSAMFDSKNVDDYVSINGLYKVDLSRSFTDAGQLSGEVFNPTIDTPLYLNEDLKNELRVVDKLSVKSLVKNYVIPILSTQYEPSSIVEAFTSGLTNNILISGMWIDEITGSFKTQYTNFIKTSMNDLTNGFINSDDALSTYTGTMNDLLTNHINAGGEIDMASLALKNPNDLPIKYYSLVVSNLKLYFRARIWLEEVIDEDGKYRRQISYNPSYRNFVFKLKIIDSNNYIVKTLYSKTVKTFEIDNYYYLQCFDILGLTDGYYTFKVYHLNDIEIYSKEFYVWNGADIDLIIDESCFIPNVVSGTITWKGKQPINNVHIKVENLDHNVVYYGEQFNGSNYFYNEYGEHFYRYPNYFYHQNSYNGESYSVSGTANGLPNIWPYDDIGKTVENGGGRACYGPSQSHEFGKYRLYDLIPGTYRLSYYIMPDTKKVDSSSDSDYDAYKWMRRGDSYYYYNLFDNYLKRDNSTSDDFGYWDEENGTYVTYQRNYDSIDDIVKNNRSFNVPLSAIQWQDGRKIMIDDYAASKDWEVMEILLYFNTKYDALSNTNNYGKQEIVTSGEYESAQESLNKRSLMFTSIREDDHFKITLTNNNDFINYYLDDSNLKELSYHSIRVLFGEKVYEQKVDITASSTILPTVDVNKMYVRKIELIGSNYDVESYRNYKSLKLLSGDSGDIEFPSATYTKTEGVSDYIENWKSIYYGVEAGKTYDISFDLRFNNQSRNLATSSIFADSTVIKEIINARDLNTLKLTVIDKAVSDKGLPGYIHRRLYGWTFFSDNAPSAYIFNSTPENPNNSFGTLEFNRLFNEKYSVGLYIDNYSDSYHDDVPDYKINNIPSSEWKYYNFNSTSITSGIVQDIPISSSVKNVTVFIPYQHLKISLNGWNVKNDKKESPSQTLTLVRYQEDGNDSTLSASNETAIRSGLFSKVSYNTTYANSKDTYEISYESGMVMDNDKTFTIYSEIDVNTVTFILKENGTAKANSKLFLYDNNKNLFKTLTTNLSGNVTDSIPYIPFYLKGISKTNDFSKKSMSFKQNKTYVFDASTHEITE